MDVMVLAANGQNRSSGPLRSPPAIDLPITSIMRGTTSPDPCDALRPSARSLRAMITQLYRNGPITHSTVGCRVPEVVSCSTWLSQNHFQVMNVDLPGNHRYQRLYRCQRHAANDDANCYFVCQTTLRPLLTAYRVVLIAFCAHFLSLLFSSRAGGGAVTPPLYRGIPLYRGFAKIISIKNSNLSSTLQYFACDPLNVLCIYKNTMYYPCNFNVTTR